MEEILQEIEILQETPLLLATTNESNMMMMSKSTFCLLCNTGISVIPHDIDEPSSTMNGTSNNPSDNVHDEPCLVPVVIKMEVIDDDDDELISFLQAHFTSIITRIAGLSNGVQDDHQLNSLCTEDAEINNIFKFCPPCYNQLLAFKQLQAQLITLQQQCQILKQQVTAGFNKTFLARKEIVAKSKRHLKKISKYVSSPSPENQVENDDETVTQTQPVVAQDPFEDDWIHSPSPSPKLPIPNNELPLELDSNHSNICYGNVRIKQEVQRNNPATNSSILRPCSVALSRIEESSSPLQLHGPIKTSTSSPQVPRTSTKPKPKRDRTKGGPFLCEVCSKSFTIKHKRTIHMRLHTGLKPYACVLCDKKFHKSENLKAHLISHTKVKSHVCEHCGSCFSYRTSYRQHLANVHNVIIGTPNQCSICGKTYLWTSDLKSHILRVHETKKSYAKRGRKKKSSVENPKVQEFSCDSCSNEKFTSLPLLKEHQITNHGIGENGEGLLDCNPAASFVNPENFKQHQLICSKNSSNPLKVRNAKKKVHKLIPVGPKQKRGRKKKVKSDHEKEGDCETKKKPHHQCEHCGQVFSLSANMQKHIRTIHEGERRYACTLCDERFTASSCLKVHMVHHTGQKVHGCEYCQLRFSKLFGKKQHMVKAHPEIHLVEKPFVCEICCSNFSTEAQRDEHVHQLHDKFKCKVCNKAFANGTRYNVHMLIHTGEKPFVCQFCSKAFNKNENLTEHVYRHTGERPYKCALEGCNEGFLRKKQLGIHMEKSHSHQLNNKSSEQEAELHVQYHNL